jgi:predicted DNA-binding protein
MDKGGIMFPITCRYSEEIIEKLNSLAATQGVPRTEILRAALEEYFKKVPEYRVKQIREDIVRLYYDALINSDDMLEFLNEINRELSICIGATEGRKEKDSDPIIIKRDTFSIDV